MRALFGLLLLVTVRGSYVLCCSWLLFGCEITAAQLKNTPDCPYPTFEVEHLYPGTNCINECIYVYEGTVNFEQQTLQINCQDLVINRPNVQFYIDAKGIPVYEQNTHWPALFIKANVKRPKGATPARVCASDFRFRFTTNQPLNL